MKKINQTKFIADKISNKMKKKSYFYEQWIKSYEFFNFQILMTQ